MTPDIRQLVAPWRRLGMRNLSHLRGEAIDLLKTNSGLDEVRKSCAECPELTVWVLRSASIQMSQDASANVVSVSIR